MNNESSMGLIRQHSSSLTMAQRLLDALFIFLAMLLAGGVRDVALTQDYLFAVSLAVLFFLLFAEAKGLYRSWRTKNQIDEIVHVVLVWFAVVISLILLAYATKTSAQYSRILIGSWVLIVPFAMVLLRIGYRSVLRLLRSEGWNTRTVAFAGCSGAAKKMDAHFKSMPWMGLNVVGVFDDRSPDRLELGDMSMMGDFNSLIAQARSGKIDVVYITLPIHEEQRILQLMDKLSDTTASVFLVPNLFVFDHFKAKWSAVEGIPIVSVFESPFFGIEGVLKRVQDVLLGGLILLLISPLMALIALGIKLTSSGPVLFKQRRYGLKGEVVEVWKFRSMTVCEDGDSIVQAKQNDARVTPLGTWLRRTSLDELPQFINVLQGQMSIVGPRPHAVAHNEEYRLLIQGYMLRHKVKPGITGWAQVNGWRGETDTLDKMQNRVNCDLAYVRNWSMWLDIKIILMTIFKGFFGKNAY
ncbi:MAG: undecaprenyl-phosphate glucose phosphotransferase [Gallionella sp.]|nr:undecaprenyl-phosphate glucose phosphotransferase [Gallionella sp.]